MRNNNANNNLYTSNQNSNCSSIINNNNNQGSDKKLLGSNNSGKSISSNNTGSDLQDTFKVKVDSQLNSLLGENISMHSKTNANQDVKRPDSETTHLLETDLIGIAVKAPSPGDAIRKDSGHRSNNLNSQTKIILTKQHIPQSSG